MAIIPPSSDSPFQVTLTPPDAAPQDDVNFGFSVAMPKAVPISLDTLTEARQSGALASTWFRGMVRRTVQGLRGESICYVEYPTEPGASDELEFVGPSSLLNTHILFQITPDWYPINVRLDPGSETFAKEAAGLAEPQSMILRKP